MNVSSGGLNGQVKLHTTSQSKLDTEGFFPIAYIFDLTLDTFCHISTISVANPIRRQIQRESNYSIGLQAPNPEAVSQPPGSNGSNTCPHNRHASEYRHCCPYQSSRAFVAERERLGSCRTDQGGQGRDFDEAIADVERGNGR